MDQEKLIIGISGVIVGFAINTIYSLIKEVLKRHYIHFNLVQELSYIQLYLQKTRKLYERKLEGKEGLHNGEYPRKLVTPIYEKYYADVCLFLNYSQRSSFQQIHAILDESNDFVGRFFVEICSQKDCSKACNLKLISSYRSLCDALYLVDNHIKYERKPIEKEQVEKELEQDRERVNAYLKTLRK